MQEASHGKKISRNVCITIWSAKRLHGVGRLLTWQYENINHASLPSCSKTRSLKSIGLNCIIIFEEHHELDWHIYITSWCSWSAEQALQISSSLVPRLNYLYNIPKYVSVGLQIGSVVLVN